MSDFDEWSKTYDLYATSIPYAEECFNGGRELGKREGLELAAEIMKAHIDKQKKSEKGELNEEMV